MRAEGHVYVEHLAQLAFVDELLDQVHAVVEAIDDADVEHLAGLMLNLLHLQRFRVGTGGGLFTQHVLSGAQRVDRNDGMHVVGRADGNGLDLGIVQRHMIIGDGGAAAIGFHGLFGALRNNIAEILDLRLRILHISGNMRRVCNGTATDDGNLHFNSPSALLIVVPSHVRSENIFRSFLL